MFLNLAKLWSIKDYKEESNLFISYIKSTYSLSN